MSYQPLHHKYRPQTFAHLVGQEAIATTLTNALRQQRIAPAYLFTGARGTGKTSSARILAKSLNCLQHAVPTEAPCGTCEVCRAIANGSALDVIEIDAASNTGVDNIRELIERAQFAPVQCRYKVYVIDECHMLSTAAFNALLKTLEEPPDRVVFVLATTDPQRVLPTIISRCQRFDFRRIPLEAMVQHLRAIASAEKISIADEAITLIAQLSQGGLRDAESLLDQLSLLAGEVTVERVWDLVGAVPEQDLMGLLDAIAQDNPEALFDTARRLMDRGREPIIVLQNLASFYRDLLIAKTAPARHDLVAITPPTWAALCQFAQTLDVSAILASQQHLHRSEAQLKNTTQPRLWLEVTLMGLLPSAIALPAPPQAALGHTASQLGPASKPPAPRPERTAPAQSSSSHRVAESTVPLAATTTTPIAPSLSSYSETADEPTADPAPPSNTVPDQPSDAQGSPPVAGGVDLVELWEAMLRLLQPPSTRMLMRQQGCLLELNEQDVRVGIVAQWHKTTRPKVANLETAFEKALHRKVQVILEPRSPAEIKAARDRNMVQGDSAENSTPPASELSDGEPSQPERDRLDTQPPAPPASWAPEPQVHPTAEEPIQPFAVSAPGSEVDRSAQQPGTSSPETWQEEDEVTKAAKLLAGFFGGKIVDLSDDDTTADRSLDLNGTDVLAAKTAPNDWDDEDSDEGEVPF